LGLRQKRHPRIDRLVPLYENPETADGAAGYYRSVNYNKKSCFLQDFLLPLLLIPLPEGEKDFTFLLPPLLLGEGWGEVDIFYCLKTHFGLKLNYLKITFIYL
jgi:hypothetical protein